MGRSYVFDLNLCHKSRDKKTEVMNDDIAYILYLLDDKGVLISSTKFIISVCTTNEFLVVKVGSVSMLTMVNEDCVNLVHGRSL